MANKVRVAMVFAFIFMLLGTAYAQEEQAVAIGVGTQKVLNIPGIARIAIGDTSIADVKVLGTSQVLIVGKTEGRTTLLLWKSNGSRLNFMINVRHKDPNEIIEEIKRLLGDREGISVRMVGDRIYLDGYAYTTDDKERVDEICQIYHGTVQSFVKYAPNAKKLVANNLNAALQRAGLKNVQATVVGTQIFLEGSAESEEDVQKALKITNAIGEKDVENLVVVGIARMILTEVQFVEIRRSNSDVIGINWPLDITGNVSASLNLDKQFKPSLPAQGTISLTSSAESNYSFQFKFSDGYGRMLAQPKLVCASGKTAKFHSGGEFPVQIVTPNSSSVEFKPYGIKLDVTPTADRHGNIRMDIKAEASEMDLSVAVNGMPGTIMREVSTTVTVRHGETIVLGGIFHHNEQKTVTKTPALGHIPILGELFKSRSSEGSKKELLIFVTPRIVNPETERIRRLLDDMKQRYKQARDEVAYSIFD
jgi:Flp pilus assembly protein, secretin CpaC